MKLIIDIDENLYKEVQNEVKGEICVSGLWKSIANGTPILTGGDLISREALKKVLCEQYEVREHYIGEKMLEAIDNAPAVHTEDCEGCPYCPNSNSGIPVGVE